MAGNSAEKKFVEEMLKKMEDKKKTQAYSATDVNQSEVEELTKSIQRRIQRGE